MDPQHIRNFCIIAHVDHGKSTLADRLLEATGTVSPREMQAQILDSMDLEREKGVTIKASAVRMIYRRPSDGQEYELNLIDTPGHVDFSYEVSRALAACEGAILVVDAAQGVEAQTIANLYLALDADLTIVPVVNKIDLPSARPDEVAQEMDDLLGIPAQDVLRVSAKENVGIAEVLEAVVARVPPPRGLRDRPLRALIFDSHYDAYKGVVAYVRIVDGSVRAGRALKLMATGKKMEPIEVGIFSPALKPVMELTTGEVGYIATGLKTVRDCSVGDTITDASIPAEMPLPGYKPSKPMVFAGLYPSEGEDYELLRDALEKLQLNDASLVYQPETSQALGFGFRCGFLGMFHMEIVQERLEREYGLDIVFTAPSVEYQVIKTNGSVITVDSPAELPPENEIAEIQEPWMKITIFTPAEFIGPVMDLVTSRRGIFKNQEYLDERRVLLTYEIPLTEILVDFYDLLKSRSRGYASLDYTFAGYRPADLVKLDVLVSKMKQVIPRQLFTVPVQAAVGRKVISRANVQAMRKDVLAKCYGGDVTRKRKLLEKQKAGKKRLKKVGQVEIPQEAFMTVLRLDED
jgi:GTP-binding protein LepA